MYRVFKLKNLCMVTASKEQEAPVQKVQKCRALTKWPQNTYRHELGTGADKLSEAEQEVLLSW